MAQSMGRGAGGGRRRHRRWLAQESAGTLAAALPGDDVVIGRIDDDTARAQALRFGMGEGATVRCMTVVPAGPLVVRAGRQEIAVGRGLARRIAVEKPVVA